MSNPNPRRKATLKEMTPSAKPKQSTTDESQSGLKVRMYRVGFGDFFLLTVPTAAGNRYIVIDCGVFKGTTGKGDIGSIVEAVEDLYQTTQGKLSLVIMTHRHADHIAGFSRAERFKDFKVDMVWMPYWEQFNDAKDSASNLQLNVEQLALKLAMQFRGRNDKAAETALDKLWNATGMDFNAADDPAKKGKGGNAAALDLLKNHFGDNGKKVRYYGAGDKPELPSELEGLTAEILGPPPQAAKTFMQLTDLKKGVGQYLDSTTGSDNGAKPIPPFPSYWYADPQQDYPARDPSGHTINYEAFGMIVDNAQPDLLVAAADKIDTFLNNQSLVVLFRFGGKALLFVGDAQAGNWEHWLYKLDAPIEDPTKAGNLTDASKEILQTIDFYKVGHHGSTNATPIAVVNALSRGKANAGFVAMCSTQTDVYGNPEKGTEVPRLPLMKALGDECALIRSDAFDITTADGIVAAVKDVSRPTLDKGTLTTGKLYIEYTF